MRTNPRSGRRAAPAVATAVACLCCAAAAAAQPYPNRPIRFVTGGGPDAMARILGPKLTEAWGQPVIVEERSGAGGMLSAELVAKASPDGHTLLLATGTHTINPNFYKLTYEMPGDFSPVTLLGDKLPHPFRLPLNRPSSPHPGDLSRPDHLVDLDDRSPRRGHASIRIDAPNLPQPTRPRPRPAAGLGAAPGRGG